MHGSQNMNHIRLINKLIYVQNRYKLLKMMSQQHVGRLKAQRVARQSRAPQSLQVNNATPVIKSQLCNDAAMSHLQYNNNINPIRRLNEKRQWPHLRTTSNEHKTSLTKLQKQKLKVLKEASPIVSNMPLIHVNSSIILVNTSPFGLRDLRFGILHHHSPSISYY